MVSAAFFLSVTSRIDSTNWTGTEERYKGDVVHFPLETSCIGFLMKEVERYEESRVVVVDYVGNGIEILFSTLYSINVDSKYALGLISLSLL